MSFDALTASDAAPDIVPFLKQPSSMLQLKPEAVVEATTFVVSTKVFTSFDSGPCVAIVR